VIGAAAAFLFSFCGSQFFLLQKLILYTSQNMEKQTNERINRQIKRIESKREERKRVTALSYTSPFLSTLSAAAGLLRGDGLALSWPDGIGGLVRRRLPRHPVFDFRRHGHERLLHIGGRLGRGFDVGHANLVGKGLGRGELHRALASQIRFIAYQQFVDGFRGVAVDLIEPLFDVGEGLGVGDVEYHDDAVRAAVVAARDGAETLLTGGVPLQ
jgi:hypothetical protein